VTFAPDAIVILAYTEGYYFLQGGRSSGISPQDEPSGRRRGRAARGPHKLDESFFACGPHTDLSHYLRAMAELGHGSRRPVTSRRRWAWLRTARPDGRLIDKGLIYDPATAAHRAAVRPLTCGTFTSPPAPAHAADEGLGRGSP
jgi:hypothetical protein